MTATQMGQKLRTFGREKSRARGNSQAQAGVQQRALEEIATDLFKECPGYGDFVSVIRRFAGSHFTGSTHEIIGVIGSQAGEGKTTVSLVLATALAELHPRVVYVEADSSGRRSLLDELGEPSRAGLTDWLTGQASLSDIIYRTPRAELSVVPFGSAHLTQGTLQTLAPLNALLGALRTGFDVVLIDMPPLLRNEAGPALLRQLNCAVIVAAANETNLDDVDRVVRLCEDLPVAGILLNKMSPRAPGWLTRLFMPSGKAEAN